MLAHHFRTMAPSRRTGRVLLAAAAACCCLRLLNVAFVPAPQAAPAPAVQMQFNPMVAAYAAVPTLTMLADDAEAKYGDARRWSAVLVPLVTLVMPGVAAGALVLWLFSGEAFYKQIPGHPKMVEAANKWREHPWTANIKDPLDGLIDRDDFEKGLEEAWEKQKPAGSTVTTQQKIKDMSTLNAPHWWPNQIASESA
mmetsp:Transcript_111412/g.359619  ORF Transcript_111412/g.359619 Transcript_111412/m.359619 type:complete len:197 (+) Transcript_111412:57-647(+)